MTEISLVDLGISLIGAALEQQFINLTAPRAVQHAGIPSRDPREGRAKVSWRAQIAWEEDIANHIWVDRYGQKI